MVRNLTTCAVLSPADCRLVIALPWIAAASSACAQQTAPPPAAAPEITVSGQHSTVTTTIDRKSYSLQGNVQATTGSAVDVMRSLPGITVDEDGNPSLRGDANVQILVDGRPDPQFNSANRGVALQQLGADGIERIEVLTNPPANFKPDGSAGIINIITKKASKRRTASATASIGSDGRFNLATTGSTRLGDLAVRGGLTLRHDIRNRFGTDTRSISDAQTGFLSSTNVQDTFTHNNRLSKIATLGLDYDLAKADRLSAEGTYYQRSETTAFAEHDALTDLTSATDGTEDRTQSGHAHESNLTTQIKYHHDLGESDEGLTLLAQRSQALETEYFSYQDRYTGTLAGPAFEDQRWHSDEVTQELNLDLILPMPAKAKLTLGYDLEHDADGYDNFGSNRADATAPAIIDTNFTNLFRYNLTIHALYGSYEREFGHITALAGARFEQVLSNSDQVTTAQTGRITYFKVYPNLHLTDAVSEHGTISFSYGRRVIRPDPEDLNPYPVQQDAFTYREGNPALLPENIQSFEAGWSFDRGGLSRSATLYLRESSNRVTNVTVPISPTVVAITKQNLGHSTSGGIELAASGRLLKALDYSLSGNVFYNTIDAANLGYAGQRGTVSYEAKIALNWHRGKIDTIQLNLGTTGRRLVPQGYRPASFGADLGARHQLRKNLALTATLSDVFATRDDGMTVTSPGLVDVSRRHQTGRILFLGLTWTPPGASAKTTDKFEYDKVTQ